MPNGDLKPCMFMKSCGNIKDNSINDIMNSNNVMETRKAIKNNNCPKCWDELLFSSFNNAKSI